MSDRVRREGLAASTRHSCSPKRAITALMAYKAMQDRERREAGKPWQDPNLVFCNQDGSMYTSRGLNWHFSKMTRKAGIGHWHAHEGRHTAVSIMNSNGVPIQEISNTEGGSGGWAIVVPGRWQASGGRLVPPQRRRYPRQHPDRQHDNMSLLATWPNNCPHLAGAHGTHSHPHLAPGWCRRCSESRGSPPPSRHSRSALSSRA